MSEHEDAVVERIATEVSAIAFFGTLDKTRVGIVLERLKPGDRLPGGLVVVRISDLEAMRDKVAGALRDIGGEDPAASTD